MSLKWRRSHLATIRQIHLLRLPEKPQALWCLDSNIKFSFSCLVALCRYLKGILHPQTDGEFCLWNLEAAAVDDLW